MKLLLLLSFFVSHQSIAETFKVTQTDKVYMLGITDEQAKEAFDNPLIEKKHKIETLNAKVGDSILFMNRDEVTHNASGLLNGEMYFDIKIQDPGAKSDTPVVFKKKGEYEVQCLIHPKMKFKVKVD